EGAAANEKDIGRVYRKEFLMRMLSSALRWDVGDGPLEDLQQCLLHSFARNVASNRGILVLAANLVDLVDIDDPGLSAFDVAVGRLQQLQDDVLYVLANVPGLGQGCRIHDGERYVEHARQGLSEKSLAGSGWPYQQDVRFLDLDVRGPALQHVYPFIMLVD